MQGSSVSPLLYRRLAAEQTAVASLIGFSDSNDVTISVRGRGGEQVGLQYVSANYFQSLGVAPAGRPSRSSPDDDRVGRQVVVVISHRLWQRMFEGRADAIGVDAARQRRAHDGRRRRAANASSASPSASGWTSSRRWPRG